MRLSNISLCPLDSKEFINQLKKYGTCEAEEKKLWEVFIPSIPKPNPEYIEIVDDKKKRKTGR
jgi:hypothetical protein